MDIEVYNETGYQAFLRSVSERGQRYVHSATVHNTTLGSISAHIKIFVGDERYQGQALFNELCGFMLAKEFGVPISEPGFLQIVPIERFMEAHPNANINFGNVGELVGWATRSVNAPSMNKATRNNPVALDSLRGWPLLPDLIAFDELVLNTDRSLENLIVSGRNKFLAIDHDQILGGAKNLNDLEIDVDATIKSNLIEEVWGGEPPPDMKSAIVSSAENHRGKISQIFSELEKWGERLNPQYYTSQLDFLLKRAENSIDRLRNAFGLLI